MKEREYGRRERVLTERESTEGERVLKEIEY